MENTKVTHHGAFLKTLWKRSRLTLEVIAERSGYSKTSIYRWMTQENIEAIKILNVANACGFDIRGLIPQVDLEMERLEKYQAKITVKDEKLYKDKYMDVLEKLNHTQDALNEAQAKYYTLKEELEEIKQAGQHQDKKQPAGKKGKS